MKRTVTATTILAPLTVMLILATCGTPANESPNLVLHNGKIVTLDGDSLIAQAVALEGDRIVGVGANEDVLSSAGDETELIDLDGKTVVPGFADNHYHHIGGGLGVDLSSTRRLSEVLEAIAARAGETPQGTVIFTNRDWHEGQLDEQHLPYRDDLDAAAPEHPVVVVRGGHEYILNSVALAKWGIDESTRIPAGGSIGRYDDGRINGELVDSAKSLVELPAEASAGRQLRTREPARRTSAFERSRAYEHSLRRWEQGALRRAFRAEGSRRSHG